MDVPCIRLGNREMEKGVPLAKTRGGGLAEIKLRGKLPSTEEKKATTERAPVAKSKYVSGHDPTGSFFSIRRKKPQGSKGKPNIEPGKKENHKGPKMGCWKEKIDLRAGLENLMGKGEKKRDSPPAI